MDPYDENPYAPPAHDTSGYLRQTGLQVGGLEREGKLLVAAKNAVFPDRCVKCNAPAKGYRMKRKLYWHPPAYYVLIFICNILIYAIVALIVRKTAQLDVGVCPLHRRKRRNATFVGWGGFLLSVGLFVAAIRIDQPLVILLAVVVLIAGIVYAIIGTTTVYPKRIDDSHAWLNGAGAEFLDSLEAEAA